MEKTVKDWKQKGRGFGFLPFFIVWGLFIPGNP